MPVAIGIDRSVVKTKTCQRCGTIHEYVPSDVKVLWSGTDYGGGSDGAEGFACVRCGEAVITRQW